MKIVMIGAGYVGLTTGACLASLGHDVTCVDIDAARLRVLEDGALPIFEPGLDELVRPLVRSGTLRFSGAIAEAAAIAEVAFIAVGTPSDPSGAIDLGYVEAAASDLARYMPSGTLVVVKSTVVAGTARRLCSLIASVRDDRDIAVASNPEFLREGCAINDFFNPDRIVIGADEKASAARLKQVYASVIERGVPVLQTSTVSAELVKYAANAFLALKIGFINDVADLCEAVDGDITDVARGIGLDQRIGAAFLSPGPGFGGSCFPKDTRAFIDIARRRGAPQHLIECLVERNEDRKTRMAQRILGELHGERQRVVAVLGVAFKANTDDVRESAAMTIIPLLQQAGCTIRAHDPRAALRAESHLSDVEWYESPLEAVRGAAATVVLTEWDEYRTLDLARLARLMSGRTLLDFRNLYEPAAAARVGLRHISLGRPARETGASGGRAIFKDAIAASPA